jgi:microcompartment protein CcmL/EutN
MKKYPAIALIESSSIAKGILAVDTMLKCSPISLIKSGTVSKGKYLILIGGSVASVDLAFKEGITKGENSIVDSVHLPDIHPQVHDAILGARKSGVDDAIATIELKTVASTVRAADAAIKGAEIDIVEIRIADRIGGKAFSILTGKLEDVLAAVKHAKDSLKDKNNWLQDTIVPRVHETLLQQLDIGTRFSQIEPIILKDGEL